MTTAGRVGRTHRARRAHVVPNDGYSLRLVGVAVLYDQGAAVASVPSAAWWTRPRCGPTARPSMSSGWLGWVVRVRTASSSTVQTWWPTPRWPARWWPPTSRPTGRGHRRRPHRCRCAGGWNSGWRRHESILSVLHPLLPQVTRSTPTAGVGGVPHRPDQGAGGVRCPHGLGDADDLVRANGDLGHAEPDRAQPGGPFGIAQTMADGIKLFFKEDSSGTADPWSSSWRPT